MILAVVMTFLSKRRYSIWLLLIENCGSVLFRGVEGRDLKELLNSWRDARLSDLEFAIYERTAVADKSLDPVEDTLASGVSM